MGKPSDGNEEETERSLAKLRKESDEGVKMAVTLTDEQIKALQAGKATIEDFTQPQGTLQVRSIKEDTILMKQALAKIGETQLTIIMNQTKPNVEIQSTLKFIIVLIFAMSLIIIGTIVLYAKGIITG